jgi:phosphate-selective porin OprO/OprP
MFSLSVCKKFVIILFLFILVHAPVKSYEFPLNIDIGGRLVLDQSLAFSDDDLEYKSRLNSLRLGPKLNLGKRFSTRTVFELRDNRLDVLTSSLSFDGAFLIRAGQLKLRTGLDITSSSLVTPMLNRPIVSGLIGGVDRQLGFDIEGHHNGFIFQLGAYRKDVNSGDANNNRTLLSRLVWSPDSNRADIVRHIGVTWRKREQLGDPITINLDAAQSSFALRRRISDSTPIFDDDLFIFEGLYQQRALTINAEWSRLLSDKVDLLGGYLDISWFLGGHRGYSNKNGAFTFSHVNQGIRQGGFGAFELVARVNYLQLDNGIEMRSQLSPALALVWHAERRLRVLLDANKTETRLALDDLKAFSINLRLQGSF